MKLVWVSLRGNYGTMGRRPRQPGALITREVRKEDDEWVDGRVEVVPNDEQSLGSPEHDGGSMEEAGVLGRRTHTHVRVQREISIFGHGRFSLNSKIYLFINAHTI